MMDAKVAGDWSRVYEFFCENYRKQVKQSSYVNRKKVTFTGYRVESITLSEDRQNAEAVIYITVSSQGFNFPETKNIQQWTYENNDWYQVIYPGSFKDVMSNP